MEHGVRWTVPENASPESPRSSKSPYSTQQRRRPFLVCLRRVEDANKAHELLQQLQREFAPLLRKRGWAVLVLQVG